MNHDYAHCLDYTKDCPKDCFRAELQRDIEENRSEFIGVPLTYAHFRGKAECELVKNTIDDTISRKAAIEEVSEECQVWNGNFVRLEKNALPFTRKLELPCDGCKFVGTIDTDFPCSRCIRREKDYYEQDR